MPVDVSDVLVTDQEMAVRLRFPGSPDQSASAAATSSPRRTTGSTLAPSCRAPTPLPLPARRYLPQHLRPIPACFESGWTTCDWSCASASPISLASRRSSASPSPSLAQLFGVRRQAVSAWLATGVPAARRAKVATVAAIADILAYRLKHERHPGHRQACRPCIRGPVDGRGHRGRRTGVAARFRTRARSTTPPQRERGRAAGRADAHASCAAVTTAASPTPPGRTL